MCSIMLSDICQCGCKGWCTFFPLIQRVKDDLVSLALGSDPNVLVCCVGSLGDWPAFCSLGGIRTWAHNGHPCFCCRCTNAQLKGNRLDNMSLDICAFDLYTENDHRADITRHQQHANVSTIIERTQIQHVLRYSTHYVSRGLLSCRAQVTLVTM